MFTQRPFVHLASWVTWLACVLLAVAPWFWAVGVHPIVSLEGEIAAWSGWTLLSLCVLWRGGSASLRVRADWTCLPLLSLAVLAFLAVADLAAGRNPYLAHPLMVIGYLLVGAFVFVAGRQIVEKSEDALTILQRLAALWLLAGLLCVAIAGWQFLRPNGIWPWIAPLSDIGRVYANLRQPNHLATMLGMSWVSLVWLSVERGLVRPSLMLVAGGLLIVGMAMTGSRTGFIILVVSAVAIALLTRARRPTWRWMAAFLAIYAFAWWSLMQIDASGLYGSFGAERLRQLPNVQDVSGARFGVWRSTLDIIAAYPLVGVGTGRFAYAYILGEWSLPATLQFTHAHNLFLHLAAEQGVPAMLLVIGAISYFLWKRWFLRSGDGVWWWAWVFPLPVAVHSMFELPLWYTYFLFPVLFSMGLLSGTARVQVGVGVGVGVQSIFFHSKRNALLLNLVMVFLLLVPTVIWRAQQETHQLYVAQEKPFFERLQLAQNSFWLRQHADHALLNTAPLELVLDPQAAILFPAVGQVLLDAKLLRSWSLNCAVQGGGERALRLAYAAKLISIQDFDRWRSLVLELNEPKLAELQAYLRAPVPVRVEGDVLGARNFCRPLSH